MVVPQRDQGHGTKIWIERRPKYKNKQQRYLLDIFSKTKGYLLDRPNLHALNIVIILIDSHSDFIRYYLIISCIYMDTLKDIQ